ncbi:hypothetical protein ONZ51_g5193 [Trametes cubensis]|uniref:Uncharacterized protein n=1 Tax=Trametes cubensis TaxID=1111947 RepID=A0AAD7TUF3_9APHY|nr:hypothetical protein ONZ51_g5193 [Trametes cubensis]
MPDDVTFERDTTALLAAEFRRLALASGWGRKSARYKNERQKFYGLAVAQDFSAFWGSTESRLTAWQDLCCHLGVDEVPTSIKGCKEVHTLMPNTHVLVAHPRLASQALRPVHVNLIDLVDSKRQNTKPKTFATETACANYTRRTGKIFPKARAKANPLLRQFLVVVF